MHREQIAVRQYRDNLDTQHSEIIPDAVFPGQISHRARSSSEHAGLMPHQARTGLASAELASGTRGDSTCSMMGP
jgi:hypothetical protein